MSTKQETAASIIAKIQLEAANAKLHVRWVRTIQFGDEIRQGDVYLYPVAPLSDMVLALEYELLPDLQLAPGDTPGSRHIIEGEAFAFEGHTPSARHPLIGPIVIARSRVTLTHPEHAHISLPAGTYQVRYQRDWSAPLPASLPTPRPRPVIRRVMD